MAEASAPNRARRRIVVSDASPLHYLVPIDTNQSGQVVNMFALWEARAGKTAVVIVELHGMMRKPRSCALRVTPSS